MRKLLLLVCTFTLILLNSTQAQNLEENFKNPSNEVRPRTWMHAMSGNMSEVGMTKDLEAIAEAGQGGVLLFNIANKIPYGDVPYNSDKHHEIITHAAKECERLNLSFGVHNCDGWTSSGGPWITPEQSMKMVVWSETLVDGGAQSVQLKQPTTREGLYKDIAVLAYPALKTEIEDVKSDPTVSSSDPNCNIDLLTDKKENKFTVLTKPKEAESWVAFEYNEPYEINYVHVSYVGEGNEFKLETSEHGVNYRHAKTFDRPKRMGKKLRVFSDNFDGIKAKHFRLIFDTEIKIREIDLRKTRPYKNYIGYSGLGVPGNYMDLIKDPVQREAIRKSDIINLSDSMTPGGLLKTTLPEGEWMILRFGYTSTGAVNWPASKWGRGLECDKFDRGAMKVHFDHFSQRVIDNAKKVAPNAMQYVEIDSYEMGGQNWTEGFAEKFKTAKGYDIISFLPILAGRYVESAEVTSKIVYDLNDLFVKLMTQNYFKYFTELCNENGIKSYIEPYGAGPVSPLDVSKHVDLPMTEFWMNRAVQRRLTGTISGAHIYGNPVISAEAFTSRPIVNWKNHPAMAKTWGDMAWVKGVNEFMFHRYVHQPNIHVTPGLTMGFWGSHFDRTQTWWKNAGPAWFDYIARGSYLLRQGYHVADVLVFMGDYPHVDGLNKSQIKYDIPSGLNFDCSNSDVLINRTKIEDRALKLPEGNAYKYLILQKMDITTLKTLRRLKEVVDGGVLIVGERPEMLAGYQQSTQDMAEFRALVDYIWQQENCLTSFDFSEVVQDFQVVDVEKSFIHRRTEEADIYFFYNQTESDVTYECIFNVADRLPERWDPHTGEIYRMANFHSKGAQTHSWINLKPFESAFVIFKTPRKGMKSIVGKNENIDLRLPPNQSVKLETEKEMSFSVKWDDGTTTKVPAKAFPETIDLSEKWSVEFLKEHFHEGTERFDKLTDWKDHENEDIKYYSGTAVYKKDFLMSDDPEDGLRYILDLGEVNVIAEVMVNGENTGVLWMAPFEVDITEFLHSGSNSLEVKITNQWANRLIGDENYPRNDGFVNSGYNPAPDAEMPEWYVNNEPMPESPRVTFETGEFYKKGDELQPSGLLGPVRIKYRRVLEINP